MIAVRKDIPENHFIHLQTETMILLNKKVNPARIFGILSLGLIALATAFKMLHLPGAGQLLVAFLISVCFTLLTGSIRSMSVYRETKGRWVIVLVTLLLMLFISGLIFKILHLPGAEQLQYASVIPLCILFPALSVYFYLSSQKLKGYLLIELIRNHQTTIEKTAMALIAFGLLFNYSSLLLGEQNFVGVIFFIFSVTLTGIYVYSLTWKYFTESEKPRNAYDLLLLVSSSLAIILFMLPVLGNVFGYIWRHFMAYLPGVILCMVATVYYWKLSTSADKTLLMLLSGMLMAYPMLRLGTKLEWFGPELSGITTSQTFILGFLLLLLILLFRFRKEPLFKAMIILTIASHMIPGL